MAASIKDNTKKRGRPVTTGTGKLIGVRLLPDLLKPLDRYIKEECPKGTSRPEALRTAFRDWATSMGYLK
jgi:hypothetical protein